MPSEPSRLRALALMTAAIAVQAWGEDPDATQRRAEARDLAMRGDEMFGAGRCDKAIPLWQQADGRFHAPTLVLRIARCEALLGRVVSAAARLETIAAEALPADAPPSWVEAQKAAAHEAQAVRARVALLHLAVDSKDPGAEVKVELDDSQVAASADVPVDPGRHRVRVLAQGVTWDRSVDIDDGGHGAVQVAVTLIPAKVLTQRRIGYVLGAGGVVVAGVAGFGFGVPAVTLSNSLGPVCGSDHTQCPPNRQGDINALQRDALIADIGVGVGAALVVAGVAVLLTSPPASTEGPSFKVVPLGTGAALTGAF